MMSRRARRIGLVGSVVALAIGSRANAGAMYTATPLSNRASSPWGYLAGIGGASLNNQGQVVGSYFSSNSTEDGFRYDSTTGKMTTYPAPAFASPSSTPGTPLSQTEILGQNDSGQMVGYQLQGGTYNQSGFLNNNGQISTVPGTPVAINNNGQIAGNVEYVNGQSTGQPPLTDPNGVSHGYIDTNGTVKDLGANVTVYAMNNAGQLTGGLNTGQFITNGAGPVVHAFYYDGQTTKDLGSLGGQVAYGLAINNHGDVTGYSQTASSFFHAFLVQQAGQISTWGLSLAIRRAWPPRSTTKGRWSASPEYPAPQCMHSCTRTGR